MPACYTLPNGKDSKGNTRFRPDPKKMLFNIDTLYLNYDSSNYDDVMDFYLRDLLIEGRENYFDSEEPDIFELKLNDMKESIFFEVMSGDKAYQYQLRNENIAIYFKKNYREDQLPMRVQINQFILWEMGVVKAYQLVNEVLKSLGFILGIVKINRVDFACHSDQWEFNLSDFDKFEYPMNFKQDNHPTFYKLNPITGEFGTAAHGDRKRLYLRIYNKSKEIVDKEKFYFFDLYKKHNMQIDKIWNVEFEVHRSILKDLEHPKLDKLFNDFDHCLSYDGLSYLWSFIVDKYGFKKNAFWSVLKKGDANNFNYIADHDLKLVKEINAIKEREVMQITGRLRTLVLDDDKYTLNDALKRFKELYKSIYVNKKGKDFKKEAEKRKRLYINKDINNTIKTIKKEHYPISQ